MPTSTLLFLALLLSAVPPCAGQSPAAAEKAGAAAQKDGAGAAPQPDGVRPPRGADRDVQPRLQVHAVADAEPVQQRQVGGAAAQEHVLAGVDGEVAAAERGGQPAQPRPALQQGDLAAGVGAAQRGADAGQPAADDGHPGAHGRLPARARTATTAFCRPDSDSRRS
jgi:hypothetical protein